MPRWCLALTLTALSCFAPADPAVRPDSLVFNHTSPLVDGTSTTWPLYLTRRGEYYAEVILERADGTQRPAEVGFDLKIRIERGDKTLFTRDISETLGHRRPLATLFWLSSDREVPIKTPLTFALEVSDVNAQSDSETLRIQIKRKLNPRRIF